MSPHPEPVQGFDFNTLVRPTGKGEQHCDWCGRMSYVGETDIANLHQSTCPSHELRRVTTALEEMTQERDKLRHYVAEIEDIDIARQQLPDGSVPGNTVECARGWFAAYNDLHQQYVLVKDNGSYNWKQKAEAVERDLAALRQERDDWRQAFETANEAIGTMESSHTQALREAVKHGYRCARQGWNGEPVTSEEAVAAYLASRDGGTAG